MHVEDGADDGLTVDERSEVAAAQAETDAAAAAKAAKIAGTTDTTATDDAAAADAAAAAKKADAVVDDAASKAAERLDRAADALTRTADAVSKLVPKQEAAAVVVEKEPDWDAERTALKAKLGAGELDEDEYEIEREKLFDRKDQWRDKKFEERANKAGEAGAAKISEAEQQRQWTQAVGRFEAVTENAKFLESPARKAAFKEMMNVVVGENPSLTYDQILADALKRTQAEFGITPETEAQKQKRIDEEAAARKKKAGKGGNGLDEIPSAGRDSMADSPFKALDALEVDDLENSLAHMKESDRLKFLGEVPGGVNDNRN